MPFSGSDITLSISFQIASDRRSGVAVIQNTTDYVSFGILLSNVTSTITLEFPDGMSTTAPAIVLNTATQTSIPLPIGADGYVMQTSSTTNYVYYSTDVVAGGVDPGTYGSSQYEAKLSCDQWIELTISTESNCFSGIVTATDTSPYYPLSPWVLVSRQLTLTPPTGLGGSPVHAPVVVSSATVSSSPHPIYTQQYTFTLNVTIQNGSVTQTLSTVKTYEVACGSICELVCMINTAFGQLSSAKSRGNIAETVRIWDVIQKGMAYIDAINYNINCSPSTIEGYTTAFKNLLLELGINTDCCGCGCSDDEPQVIYPQGGSGGTSISVTATPAPWLTYTYDSGTGTYTVILSQNAVDILTAARLYAFTSSDGSINISQSTSGSNPPTVTADLTVSQMSFMSFFVTLGYNQTAMTATQTVSNIVRSGKDVWARSNINPYPLVNPIFSPISFGSVSGMRVERIFSDGTGNPNPQSFFVEAKVVSQVPIKAYQASNIWINRLTDIASIKLPTSGTGSSFDILFDQFLGTSPNPLFGLLPLSYTNFINYFESVKIQITIYLK